MATKSNVTKVQVPGEAAAPEVEQDQDQDQAAAAAKDAAGAAEDLPPAGGADAVDVDAMQAQIDAQAEELRLLKEQLAKADAQADAQPATTPGQKTPSMRPGPGGRSDFTHLRAHEIDVKSLTRPVQCADGWLVPETIAKEKA